MVTLLLAALVTVTGTVHSAGDPLPGVPVTLTRGSMTRTAITDEHGRYSFDGVEEGICYLRYELAGFRTAERPLRAGGEVPVQPLELVFESLTGGCERQHCSPEPPETAYDLPLCSEYGLNTVALEAARSGDRSAMGLLRARYAHTSSLMERSRIAAALLDDAQVRDELLERARVCVRFPDEEAPAYLAWCAERQLPPAEHWSASFDALVTVAGDRSARALLLEALRSSNQQVRQAAITGLAMQRDDAALPAIERALQEQP